MFFKQKKNSFTMLSFPFPTIEDIRKVVIQDEAILK